MWAFTGGCHYDFECGNFISRCDQCPSLRFKGHQDFSSTIFARKLNLYKNFNPYIVTCSSWLADEAKKSLLLKGKKIASIPNPIDIKVFKPYDKLNIKKKLGISTQKFHILFATMTISDERKGFKYFKDALFELDRKNPNLRNEVELIVMGSIDSLKEKKFPYQVKYIGRL